MDIQKLRQEFEKLPDIKGILHGSDFGFSESLNQYYHPDHTNHRLNYAFIMGAWMAWKTKAQAPEGFVLVPKECSDDMAEIIAITANVCGGIAGDVYDAILNQAMIEAQEQSHD